MGILSRDAVFIDTCFYVAILNPRDSLHSIAESIAMDCGDAITTSECQSVIIYLASQIAIDDRSFTV
jgi:predicted nucleic acid-binding protein